MRENQHSNAGSMKVYILTSKTVGLKKKGGREQASASAKHAKNRESEKASKQSE